MGPHTSPAGYVKLRRVEGTTYAMNNLALLRKVLGNPTSHGLASALRDQDIAQEVLSIAHFDDRQLLDFTGTVGPSQFRTIMVACRLAPREIAISFVMECAILVLPIAFATYPRVSVLAELASLSGSIPLIAQAITRLRDEIEDLYKQSQADDEGRRRAIFDQLGYVPLETGVEIGRVSSAVCLLSMATVIVSKQESPKFVRNVDGMMIALVGSFPARDEELGQWAVSKLRELIEVFARQNTGSADG